MSPTHPWRAVALALCVGCGPAKEDAARAPTSSVTMTSPSIASASSTPEPPPRAPVVCTLRDKTLPELGFTLRVDDAAAPFADTTPTGVLGILRPQQSTEVSIAASHPGPPPTLGLHLESTALALDGRADTASIALYAAKPMVLGGMIIPTDRLTLVEASADGVTVEPKLGATIALAAPVRARVPCADLRLRSPTFDGLVDLPAKPQRRAGLRAKKTVSLGVEIGGGGIAARITPISDTAVEVLETRGRATRIAYFDLAWIFGWVATSELGPAPQEDTATRRACDEGVMGAPDREPLDRVACPKDVPLLAEVGGVRSVVGRVRANAHLVPLAREAGFTVVRVPGDVIHAAEGARWLVADKDLEGCPTVREPASLFDAPTQ
ncbi:MAG: hypothetical protein U0271_18365 [Polyangiaceae bacterium]